MSLDVYNLITPDIASNPGTVTLKVPAGDGGYTGPGGTWEESAASEVTLTNVVIQQADMRTAEFLNGNGGTVDPSDLRNVYINDGTTIYPDDEGQFAHVLEFSDGLAVREWRVRQADNRPWHNYCKVVVERYRGKR